jgi:hypothetical protein
MFSSPSLQYISILILALQRPAWIRSLMMERRPADDNLFIEKTACKYQAALRQDNADSLDRLFAIGYGIFFLVTAQQRNPVQFCAVAIFCDPGNPEESLGHHLLS